MTDAKKMRAGTTPVCCYCDADLSCAQCGMEQPSCTASNQLTAGTTECPICGVAEPHPHVDYEIEYWLQAQASRFGYFVRAFRTVELRDGFIKEALKELEYCQREWCRSEGYELHGYTDAINALKEYAALAGPVMVTARVVAEKIIRDIIRPGFAPEERTCHEIAAEIRAIIPDLESTAAPALTAGTGVREALPPEETTLGFPKFELAEDETGGPIFIWINPWSGEREKIANLWWPTHPAEATEEIERLFSELQLHRALPPARESFDMTEQPVAWIVLSEETGNTRIWWRDKEYAEAWAAKHEKTPIPLYAAPPSLDPATIEACAKVADLKFAGSNLSNIGKLVGEAIRALGGRT